MSATASDLAQRDGHDEHVLFQSLKEERRKMSSVGRPATSHPRRQLSHFLSARVKTAARPRPAVRPEWLWRLCDWVAHRPNQSLERLVCAA
jgi:hypothetical protein